MKVSGFWRTAFLSFAFWMNSAQADILVSPTRAILSDERPQAVISLYNPGTTPSIYGLSWVEHRFTEDGKMLNLKEGENPSSVAGFVHFSPRRVVVAPGQTQTVRVSYHAPADLAPGEYRSYLRIAQEASPGAGTPVASGEQKGITFQLNALMSYAVPVFVRHGAGTATAAVSAIEPTQVKRDGGTVPALKVSLTHGGVFSSYGRIAVYQQLDANAPVELIGEAGAVAIYTEVLGTTRVVELKPGNKLEPGSWIRVTYEGEDADRGQVYAERSFQVGK